MMGIIQLGDFNASNCHQLISVDGKSRFDVALKELESHELLSYLIVHSTAKTKS